MRPIADRTEDPLSPQTRTPTGSEWALATKCTAMPPVRQGSPPGNTAPDDEHRTAACVVAGGLGPIRASLKLFLEAGGVAELRVPHTTRGTVSGYFDDPDKLAEAAGAWS